MRFPLRVVAIMGVESKGLEREDGHVGVFIWSMFVHFIGVFEFVLSFLSGVTLRISSAQAGMLDYFECAAAL